MIKLGVNIDHVATIRQARGTEYPSVIEAAAIAEAHGADLITVHLREDRRHIQDHDIESLAKSLTTRMNLEMAIADEMVQLAKRIRPADVCLVPEKREELTTEGGLDVMGGFERVQQVVSELEGQSIRVSLFIAPDTAQIEAAKKTGAAVIELHTGTFADAETPVAQAHELQRIKAAVQLGLKLGLVVNAGHGLHYHNVHHIASIPGIDELNIGHAIVAHALFVGWDNAVREMKALVKESAPAST